MVSAYLVNLFSLKLVVFESHLMCEIVFHALEMKWKWKTLVILHTVQHGNTHTHIQTSLLLDFFFQFH